MYLLDPDNINWIVLHCSASPYGDVDLFDKWHKDRDWEGIGYHYVITNCFVTYEDWKNRQPNIAYDGNLQKGRSEKFQGAHVKGHNWESLGVCLVGEGLYSSRQLETAARICKELIKRYPSIQGIRGHNDFTDQKTCPELDVGYFTRYIFTNIDSLYNDPIFDPSIFKG